MGAPIGMILVMMLCSIEFVVFDLVLREEGLASFTSMIAHGVEGSFDGFRGDVLDATSCSLTIHDFCHMVLR